MMKAEEMRKIMEKAIENKRVAKVNESHAYAKKIADTKFKRRARNGFNNCQFKVSRWQSPALVAEQLELMGFEVKKNSKDGKAILVVKW